MRPADRAWLALVGGIAAWDKFCPHGEMLSDASARYTKNHPVLWVTSVVYIAGHLIHIWPKRYDVLSILATAFENENP